jgi:outer membrane protein TolC
MYRFVPRAQPRRFAVDIGVPLTDESARGPDMSILLPGAGGRPLRPALAVFLLAAAAPFSLAQQPAGPEPAPPPSPAAVPENVPTLSLAECLAIADERQPVIRAAMHSLAASEAGAQSLNNLGLVARLITAELPVRREQASRGITIATAEVQKTIHETTYDVTVLYFTYVYAHQQEITAIDVIEQMEIYYDVAREIVKTGAAPPGGKKIDQFTLYALQHRISDVRLLKVKAENGRKRALDALKEAMGVDPCFDFVPRTEELPVMGGTVAKEQVVELALSRRPEIAQAAAGVDAFRLEVCAQSMNRRGRQVPTLAAGSDLHSRIVLPTIRDPDYRPGGINPEMPVGLVGNREDRVARAAALSQRQDVLYEKVVNLIRLEASNAYLEYEAATLRMNEAKRRFEDSRKMVEDSRTAAVTRQDPELLVNNEALAGRAQADFVEAVYEHIRAQARLERVTGGGVRPDFAAAAALEQPRKNHKNNKRK